MDRAAVLQQELDELRAQITALEKALEEKPDYGLGRGDPGVTRWELDQALLRRLKRRAAELERALSRVGQGTYGICVRCGRPIHRIAWRSCRIRRFASSVHRPVGARDPLDSLKTLCLHKIAIRKLQVDRSPRCGRWEVIHRELGREI